MPEQLESSIANEIDNVAPAGDIQSLEKNVTDIFVALRRSLIAGLFAHLEQQTAHLRAEAAAKAEKSAELRNRHAELKPRVEARQRTLNYRIDEAIAESRDGDVGELKNEIVKATKDLDGLIAQAALCDQRVAELSKLQKERARKIFEADFPEIREALVTVEGSLCDLLDGVWDDLERYQSEAGLEGVAPSPGQPYERSLLAPALRADLTARDKGPEGEVFQRLLQWFGVGRR